MAEESPTRVSNDELLENGLILVQQLFADNLINDQERDHLKGTFRASLAIFAWLRQANKANQKPC